MRYIVWQSMRHEVRWAVPSIPVHCCKVKANPHGASNTVGPKAEAGPSGSMPFVRVCLTYQAIHLQILCSRRGENPRFCHSRDPMWRIPIQYSTVL